MVSSCLPQEFGLVRFNPWMYKHPEDIWRAFVAILAVELDKTLPPRSKLAFLLRSNSSHYFSAALQRLAASTRKFSTWILIALTLGCGFLTFDATASVVQWSEAARLSTTRVFYSLATLIIIWKFINILICPFATYFSAIKGRYTLDSNKRLGAIIKSDFDAISKYMDKSPHRIVVFLEDLDRCDAKQIAAMLEFINVYMAQLPVCVFAGFDSHVIHDSLVKDQASTINDPSMAREFLQKIVNITFHIPPLSLNSNYLVGLTKRSGYSHQDIIALLAKQEKLSTLIDPVFEETALDWIEQNFKNNPRQLKKLLNQFRLALFAYALPKYGEEADNEQLTLANLLRLAAWMVLVAKWPNEAAQVAYELSDKRTEKSPPVKDIMVAVTISKDTSRTELENFIQANLTKLWLFAGEEEQLELVHCFSLYGLHIKI